MYNNSIEAGLDSEDFIPFGPSKKTNARPGSRAKIEIMAIRVACGLQIHHPQDFVLEHEMGTKVFGVERCLGEFR
jgi:hypothetical protein